mgnify:CR=1 FL=1
MSEDFDKSGQKVKVVIAKKKKHDTWSEFSEEMAMEIESRPHMRLTQITPFAAHEGDTQFWFLIFEEKDDQIRAMQEDIKAIREYIARMVATEGY